MGNQSTIMFMIFWDFLIVEQILFSPQVKRIVIISNKLVHIRVASQVAEQFKSQKTSRKSWNFIYRIIPQCLVPLPKWTFSRYKQKAPGKEKLSFSRSVLFHIKATVSFKYFVNDINSNKEWIIRHSSPWTSTLLDSIATIDLVFLWSDSNIQFLWKSDTIYFWNSDLSAFDLITDVTNVL